MSVSFSVWPACYWEWCGFEEQTEPRVTSMLPHGSTVQVTPFTGSTWRKFQNILDPFLIYNFAGKVNKLLGGCLEFQQDGFIRPPTKIWEPTWVQKFFFLLLSKVIQMYLVSFVSFVDHMVLSNINKSVFIWRDLNIDIQPQWQGMCFVNARRSMLRGGRGGGVETGILEGEDNNCDFKRC